MPIVPRNPRASAAEGFGLRASVPPAAGVDRTRIRVYGGFRKIVIEPSDAIRTVTQ